MKSIVLLISIPKMIQSFSNLMHFDCIRLFISFSWRFEEIPDGPKFQQCNILDPNGTRKILSYFTSRNQQNNRFHSKTHLLFHHKNTLCCTKIPLVCYLGCFFIWERFRVAGYQSFSSATFWFPIVEIHKTINSTRKLIYYCVSTLC